MHRTTTARSLIVCFLASLVAVVAGTAAASAAAATATTSATAPAEDPAPAWPSWGGPNGDFSTADPGLELPWDDDLHPVELWRRPLGEGYSTLAVDDERLYVLFGDQADGLPQEKVAALLRTTGEPLWETSYPALRPDGMRLNHGEGPHAQPTLVGERVFTIGTTGLLHAFDRDSGEILWQTDLWQDHGAERLRRGYGSSPLAVTFSDGTPALLVPAGGKRQGMIAFAPEDGRVLWRSEAFEAAQSSPILLESGGRRVVVLFIRDALLALDPDDGGVLWRIDHPTLGPYNITTPAVLPRHVGDSQGDPEGDASGPSLVITSSYGGGSRRVDIGPDLTRAESVWQNDKIGVHFTNVLALDDVIVLSNGRSSPYATALDPVTGELLWRDRALGRANFLRAGNQILALEESGRLVALRVDRSGIEVLADHRLFDERCWSAPSLVGDVLYVRTRTEVAAFRLPTANDR